MKFSLSALILAAGKGVRMKSTLPKVVHPILGKPMVTYVVNAARAVGASEINVVVGFGKDYLIKALSGLDLKFVEQTEQLGTGHAVQCYAKACFQAPDHLLVVCGDTPLLSQKTLQEMAELHFSQQNDLTLMTLDMQDPGKYGRILRDAQGRVKAIREEKDCTPDERQVKEINLAVYLFRGKPLFERLFQLKNDNRQKEYYLTDLLEMMANDGLKIAAVKEHDESSTLGINSRLDMAKVTDIMKQRLLQKHMENGVTIIDPVQTLIEPDVVIGSDSTLWPGVTLTGKTVIGNQANLGPNVFMKDCKVGNQVSGRFFTLENAQVPDNTVIPPFTSSFRPS